MRGFIFWSAIVTLAFLAFVLERCRFFVAL